MTDRWAIETLERRRAHLSARIRGSKQDLSFDRMERAALTRALKALRESEGMVAPATSTAPFTIHQVKPAPGSPNV
jgi:hypothetical protein